MDEDTMFGRIKRRWRSARESALRQEVEDALARLPALGDVVNLRVADTLGSTYRMVLSEYGPLENMSNDFRDALAKELRDRAKARFDRDVGGGYGTALLSQFIEAHGHNGQDAEHVISLIQPILEAALDVAENVDHQLE